MSGRNLRCLQLTSRKCLLEKLRIANFRPRILFVFSLKTLQICFKTNRLFWGLACMFVTKVLESTFDNLSRAFRKCGLESLFKLFILNFFSPLTLPLFNSFFVISLEHFSVMLDSRLVNLISSPFNFCKLFQFLLLLLLLLLFLQLLYFCLSLLYLLRSSLVNWSVLLLLNDCFRFFVNYLTWSFNGF